MLTPNFLLPADKHLRLAVTGGRVDCPRLGSVDLERCAECPYLVRFADARALHVICQATDSRFPE
jgi:hypothetical protein